MSVPKYPGLPEEEESYETAETMDPELYRHILEMELGTVDDYHRDPQKTTVLHRATGFTQYEIVQLIRKELPFYFPEKNAKGDTAIHIATIAVHTLLATLFVYSDFKGGLGEKNEEGNTPLHEALEILLLDASGDDSEHNWTHENFNNRIIREGDMKKPHFAKSVYVPFKKGVGILKYAKFGRDSYWMKDCKCRLGARIKGNFGGIEVQEAWTESFMVSAYRTDGLCTQVTSICIQKSEGYNHLRGRRISFESISIQIQ